MIVNAEVKRKEKENSIGLLKRFNRKVQESGILRRVRSIRYLQREPSKYTKKQSKLTAIQKKEDRDLQIKLGKIAENPRKRGR